jgi:hypothetical protein
VIRLQADDPGVLALTRTALEQSRHLTPALTIRCVDCRAVLAHAGYTPTGPLFTSTWRYALPADMNLNGQPLNRRRQHRVEQELGAEVEGAEDIDGTTGVIALLALPAGMPPDYPDLAVRCPRHGDLLLDRLEALERLRGSEDWDVRTERPRLELVPPDSSWLAGAATAVTRTTRRTVRYRWSSTTADGHSV